MKKNDIRHEGMRIGGEKILTEKVIEVKYPYTNEVVGTVPAGTAEHAARAFKIASDYKPSLSRYERSQILQRTGEIIAERQDYLAKWLTLELGICHQHAIYETKRAQDVYQFAAAQAMNDDGQIFSCDLTHNGKERKIFTKREPVRAISAITPFNHPLNMVSHKIAPSIATNNCMVCKPTELTPLTAITLADILYEAGLPPEMFQIVTGLPEDIGEEMMLNEHIDIITFTGGVPVGKLIASKAGYKRQALELGGNDPLIVCNDLSGSNLDKAATIAVAGATGNSGQRCTAIKRILVQESVADAFVPKTSLDIYSPIAVEDAPTFACPLIKEALKWMDVNIMSYLFAWEILHGRSLPKHSCTGLQGIDLVSTLRAQGPVPISIRSLFNY